LAGSRNGPDLVLSDINMPGKSGFELLMDIRSLGREIGAVPVIAMTAYIFDQSVLDAGFQRILRKPFAPDELLAAIDLVLYKM
jgi:CheY-like chemotaxis protein